MIRRIMIIFVCFHLFVGSIINQYPGCDAAAEEAWREVINSDGIIVWERTFRGSSFYEFTGETIIPADATEILKILWDIKGFPTWLPDVVKAEIIKEIDENTIVYHDTTAFLWPISDRDCIIRIHKKSSANGIIEVTLKSLLDFNVPSIEGTVRARELRGKYLIEPLNPDKTRISYQLFYDPAGEIPPMMVNPGIRDNIYNTLKRLAERVQKK